MPTRRFHKKKRTTRKSRKTRRMMGGSLYEKLTGVGNITQMHNFNNIDFYEFNKGSNKYIKIGKFDGNNRKVVFFKKKNGEVTQISVSPQDPVYYKFYKSEDSLSMSSPSKTPYKF
jgi:hypothetical protein